MPIHFIALTLEDTHNKFQIEPFKFDSHSGIKTVFQGACDNRIKECSDCFKMFRQFVENVILDLHTKKSAHYHENCIRTGLYRGQKRIRLKKSIKGKKD